MAKAIEKQMCVKYIHCLNCGIELTNRQRHSRYVHCSQECKAYTLVPICHCKHCGKEFKPIGRDRMTFCCRSHSDAYRWIHRMSPIALKLRDRMRNGMNFRLRYGKGGRSWLSLVDYSVDQLKLRLKRTMPKGFTWEDFLGGRLHIDHIIPISAFNFTKPEHIDFKRCWALDNLQLLPKKENLVKSNKIDKPFQPSLLLAVG